MEGKLKKKIVLAFSLLAVIAFLCACGKDSDDVDQSVSDNEAQAAGTVSGSDAAGEAGDASGNDASTEHTDVSGDDIPEEKAMTLEDMLSEEGALYVMRTSDGSHIGMTPIVAGNAVVLLDSDASSVYQGEYVEGDTAGFSEKLKAENKKAVSEGKIGDWAFYRELMLKDFEWQGEISSIGKFAFSRSGLTRVEIPDGVTSIGYAAFYHCDSLTEVVIPGSVTAIEENAFAYTPWLENWMAGGGDAEESDFLIVGDGILIAYRGEDKDPVIPDGVKSIAPGVF